MPAAAPKFIASPSLVPESQRFRARARECRLAASRLRLGFAREHMLNAADGFEQSAREEQEREIARGISRLGELVRGLHRAG